MMKKKYLKPVSEIIEYEAPDIIVTSSWKAPGHGNSGLKPGNGYGDKNHNHGGPHGHKRW